MGKIIEDESSVIERLRSPGFISVRKLAKDLGVSPQTILRIQKRNGIHIINRGLKGIERGLRLSKEELIEKMKTSRFRGDFKFKLLLYKFGLKSDVCERCGWGSRPEHKIKPNRSSGLLPVSPCEIHHKNGDRYDNRIENLEILCPNCHSLTPNYRYRGGKKDRYL